MSLFTKWPVITICNNLQIWHYTNQSDDCELWCNSAFNIHKVESSIMYNIVYHFHFIYFSWQMCRTARIWMEQCVSNRGQVLDVSVHLVSKVKDVTHTLLGTRVMAVWNVHLVSMVAHVVSTHRPLLYISVYLVTLVIHMINARWISI